MHVHTKYTHSKKIPFTAAVTTKATIYQPTTIGTQIERCKAPLHHNSQNSCAVFPLFIFCSLPTQIPPNAFD